MKNEEHQKVTSCHLKRNAYLYIRQSTIRQVFENTESTQRQYALRQRAVALGWLSEQVVVIDCDLGHSGGSTADREGFQRLVADVSMGKAGLVMGLEVSRLARNCTDWHRLLEICGLTDTLLLDEDGLYDPMQFNDRLVLGLKGTMSEAELHLLRARLQGGILSKAKRGELRAPLPIGFVYNSEGQVIVDPDQQVQESLRIFFQTYRRIGTAWGTVQVFRKQKFLFPRRLRKGVRKGELVWGELRFSRALSILHNPRYAGAFFFGRTRTRKTVDGGTLTKRLPKEEWHTLLPDAHEGYISWEEYEGNQRRLRETAQAYGGDRRKSPPREGPALLQGLILCGRCGQRMTVRYHQRSETLIPDYLCQRAGIEQGGPICQQLLGADIDKAVETLLLESMTPVTLEVALQVQHELQSRLAEADQLRQQQIERARYEAELARRRYMQVDPENRLVADTLEAEWNEKLRDLNEIQEANEKQSQKDRLVLNEKQKKEIMALVTDFPKLWHNPQTPQRERKRIARLLLEDVTLIQDHQIKVHVRFKGGAMKTLILPLPTPNWKAWTTDPKVVQEIDLLLDQHTEREIASILNERGYHSGKGLPFHPICVARIRRSYQLKNRYDRLRERGMLTQEEVANQIGVASCTIRMWRNHGLLKAHAYNDKNECLYEPPGQNAPTKMQGQKLSERRPSAAVAIDHTKEVQYEAETLLWG